MRLSQMLSIHAINQASGRPANITVIGQAIDDFSRVRPKLPIGPRGDLAHVFPTYIGFEGSRHAIQNHG